MKKFDFNNMKRCIRCALNENTSDLVFSSDGLCNYCKDFDEKREEFMLDKLQQNNQQKFLNLVHTHSNSESDYDAIMLYSGGKDSTYVLSKLLKDCKLKILAVTFDNWFLSEKALSMQKAILSKLGVDQLIVRPDKLLVKEIFKRSISAIKLKKHKNYFARHGALCWPCFSLIYSYAAKIAIEKKINLIIGGWDPGQLSSGQHQRKKNGLIDFLDVVNIFIKPFQEMLGFWEKQSIFSAVFSHHIKNVYILPFFQFWPYNKINIQEYITLELGWKTPDGLDSCSTNCCLNRLDRILIRKYFGFDRYAVQAANMVRMGALDKKSVENIELESLEEGLSEELLNDLDLTNMKLNED